MIILINTSYWKMVFTFGIQTIHHRLNNVQFGLDGEVDEIGVN